VRRSVAIPFVVSMVMAACGGGGGGTGGAGDAGDLGPAVEANAVSIVEGRKFEPASIVVAVGTAVTWSNKDKAGHTITSGVPGQRTGVFDRTMSPGRSDSAPDQFSFTFDKPGVYPYFCQFHSSTMRGQVEVK
jgi:plastocyanin